MRFVHKAGEKVCKHHRARLAPRLVGSCDTRVAGLVVSAAVATLYSLVTHPAALFEAGGVQGGVLVGRRRFMKAYELRRTHYAVDAPPIALFEIEIPMVPVALRAAAAAILLGRESRAFFKSSGVLRVATRSSSVFRMARSADKLMSGGGYVDLQYIGEVCAIQEHHSTEVPVLGPQLRLSLYGCTCCS